MIENPKHLSISFYPRKCPIVKRYPHQLSYTAPHPQDNLL